MAKPLNVTYNPDEQNWTIGKHTLGTFTLTEWLCSHGAKETRPDGVHAHHEADDATVAKHHPELGNAETVAIVKAKMAELRKASQQ